MHKAAEGRHAAGSRGGTAMAGVVVTCIKVVVMTTEVMPAQCNTSPAGLARLAMGASDAPPCPLFCTFCPGFQDQ